MDKPFIEAAKEVGRWVVLFIASWAVIETINQLANVPEFLDVGVWVFTYTIPIRLVLQTVLTLAGRFVDKLLYETAKEEPKAMRNEGYLGEKGLTGF